MWYFWVTKYNPKTEKWKTTWKYELNTIQRQINEKILWKYGLNMIQRQRNENYSIIQVKYKETKKKHEKIYCVKDKETRKVS